MFVYISRNLDLVDSLWPVNELVAQIQILVILLILGFKNKLIRPFLLQKSIICLKLLVLFPFKKKSNRESLCSFILMVCV